MQTESLDAIGKAVARGSAVVRHLLTFARKEEGSFRVLDVNEILREVVQMISASFPRNIRVSPDLASALPLVHGDQNQLHQAFLNLCVNARDAMGSGGALRISTSTRPAEEVRKRFAEANRDYYVCVTIRDDGVGMEAETRERAFEPFFTTKGRTGGAGMGLSVVYGVITSHRGFVDFDSAPGEGTEFRLYLPIFTGLPPEPEMERLDEGEIARARKRSFSWKTRRCS
jgi:signal transduction histidine kinase